MKKRNVENLLTECEREILADIRKRLQALSDLTCVDKEVLKEAL
jgi:hypothetical protein